jgi:excisionase family DNA binding protein
MTEIKELIAPPPDSGLRTVREASRFLRLKVPTIRSWILHKKIDYVKLGGRVFLRQSDLDKLITDSLVTCT